MSDQHNEDLRRWIEDRDVGFEKPFLDNIIIITSDSADKQPRYPGPMGKHQQALESLLHSEYPLQNES